MTREQDELIRVVLELEAAASPIRGAVRTDAGARPFDGWMQLTAALEEVRAQAMGAATTGGLPPTETDGNDRRGRR